MFWIMLYVLIQNHLKCIHTYSFLNVEILSKEVWKRCRHDLILIKLLSRLSIVRSHYCRNQNRTFVSVGPTLSHRPVLLSLLFIDLPTKPAIQPPYLWTSISWPMALIPTHCTPTQLSLTVSTAIYLLFDK